MIMGNDYKSHLINFFKLMVSNGPKTKDVKYKWMLNINPLPTSELTRPLSSKQKFFL